MGYRLNVIILIIATALTVAACSTSAPEVSGEPSGSAAPPAPAGVDPGLWRELTAELDAQLAARGTSAAKPITDPLFTVDDLEVTGSTGGSVTLAWTYTNPGDYDVNGEVNAADLAKIAKYYRSTSDGSNWNEARIADGDGNGEVNGGDIVSISANFGNRVNGFLFGMEMNDYDGSGAVTAADLTPIGVHAIFPTHSAGVTGVTTGGAGFSAEPRTADLPVPNLWIGYMIPTAGDAKASAGGTTTFSVSIPFFSDIGSCYYCVFPYSGGPTADQITHGQPSNFVLHKEP